MFGMRFGQLGTVNRAPSLAEQIAQMFASGEPGAWYDPSDMSTLFQDSAGTVPVTAVEQPVGRILDKSGRGNHATQATTTKRPVLSRRVNLLTKTEYINDAAWSKPGVSVISSGVLAPDGTMSAFTIKAAASAGSKILWYLQSGPTSATSYTSVVWIRNRSVIPGGAYIRLVNSSEGVIAGSHRQFPAVASGWVQMSISGTHAGASGGALRLDIGTDGDEEGEWDIWHPSLTLSADSHLPYQRVNTDTDYDADPAKFPAYLRWDGVDDAMQTGNIDFTGTDKMTVWAGVWAPPDDGRSSAIVCIPDTGLSRYWLGHPFSGFTYSAAAGATTERSRSAPFVAGNAIITASLDLAGVQKVAVNGGTPLVNAGGTGGGNFRNAPISIGADIGSNRFYLNGRLYSLIVRGAQSTLSQIEATELYMKKKVGIA